MSIKFEYSYLSEYFYADNDTANAFINTYFENRGKIKPVIRAFETLQLNWSERSIVALERFRQAIHFKKSRSRQKAMGLLQKRVNECATMDTFLICCLHGYLDIAQMIDRAKVPIDIRTMDRGFTPLHISVEKGYLKMTEWLISKKVQLDGKNIPELWTPLHFACDQKAKKEIRLLLKAGANPNMPTVKGFTPLHIACINQDLQTAGDLLRFGANSKIKDAQGRRPKDLLSEKLKLLPYYTTPHPLFPKEIWKKIMQYIPKNNIPLFQRVSREWNHFIKSLVVESLFE